MFQLVKQVADFPNVIYVLVMDREVVCNALTEVHKFDGSEYLEKIIQVPFMLPEIKKSKLNNIFFRRLDWIINKLPTKVEWDKFYWGEIFENCVNPYIHTLRDINRVINTFQFRYGALYQETSFEDMVGMTTLEVMVPELYNWIGENKETVCGGFKYSFLSNSSKKPDYRKLYYDEFTRLGINPELAIRCIATMFPVFAKDVNEFQHYYKPSSNVRAQMRAAHEEKFDLYFMFDFDDVKVPRSMINACIYELERAELLEVIKDINEQGGIVYFLEELRSLVDNIPYERLEPIASVILTLQGGFNGEDTQVVFRRSAGDIAEYLSIDMINRLNTEKEKYEIIRNAVTNANTTGIGTMARIINRIELAYGRLAGNSVKEEAQIISLEHLEELEKIYAERIQTLAYTEQILDMNGFNIAFYLWKSLDAEGVLKYLDKAFECDANKLRFICAMAGQWYGTGGSGWGFHPGNYSEYISQDEVYNLIQNLDKNMLDEFTETQQIQLASFVLNYQESEMKNANEEEAQKLVDEWKSGKKTR